MDKIAKREQLTNSLQKYSTNISAKKNSVSIYFGGLTPQFATKQIVRLKAAFPNTPPEMYDVLMDRLKANGFTDARLEDAINNLIDNFKYPVPSIAEIIGFDKRVKLYNYKEICDYVNDGGSWEDFKIVKREGHKPVWVRENEFELIKHIL